MKNINIEEVKRYLKRSLKKKVKITTSLIVLFMMSNSIGMATAITIENGKIGSWGKDNTGKGSIALNPKGENDSKVQYQVVKDYAIAIGLGAEANASDSVSIGHSSVIENGATKAIAIGNEAKVYSTKLSGSETNNSIAIGTKAEAYIFKSVAIGEGAQTLSVDFYNNGSRDESKRKNGDGGQSTAIGSGAVAVDQATSVGNDTYAIGRSSIAIGSDDNRKFREETTNYDFDKYFKNLYNKIGNSDGHKYGAKVNLFTKFGENDYSYNYSPTLAAGEGGIALGTRALSYGIGATSIGAMSFALGDYSTAMGAKTRAEGKGAIAIGNSTKVFSDHSVAVGNENQILNEGGTAYGYKAYSGGENSIAIGSNVYSNTKLSDNTKGIHGIYTGKDNGYIFDQSYMTENIDNINQKREQKLSEDGSLSVKKTAKNDIQNIIESDTDKKNSVVLGTRSMASDSNSMALGHGTFSLAKNSMAFGSFSYVKGENSLGLGVDSKVLSNNSIAIGTRAGVGYKSDNSLVMGNFSYSTGENALVFGNKSKVTAEDGLAIGSNSEASLANSTALGVNSKTDYTKEDLEKDAYAPRGVLSMPSTEKIGVISVGSKGAERRVVNVAAGYRDTDAVNVSQLKAMEEKINQSGLMDVEDDDLNISDNGIHYLSVDKNGYRSKDIKEIMQKQRDYNKYIEYKSRQLEMKAREARGDKLPDPYKTKINAKVENLENKYKNDTQFNQIELKKITDQEIEGIKNNGASFDAIITKINLAKEKDKYITYTDENGQEIQKLKTILYEDEVKKINESNYNNKGAIGKDSIALGYQTKSIGDKGIAIGTGDQRSLDILEKQKIIDVSRGEEKQKLVNKEIRLNNNMYTRSGENAVAVGTGAIAKDWSVALGGNTQTEDTAVAIGDRSKALGNRSIAIGNKAATGRYYEFNGKEKINETLKKSNIQTLNYDSIGMVGYDGAEKAIAIGSHSTATSDYSVAIGNGATTGDNKTYTKEIYVKDRTKNDLTESEQAMIIRKHFHKDADSFNQDENNRLQSLIKDYESKNLDRQKQEILEKNYYLKEQEVNKDEKKKKIFDELVRSINAKTEQEKKDAKEKILQKYFHKKQSELSTNEKKEFNQKVALVQGANKEMILQKYFAKSKYDQLSEGEKKEFDTIIKDLTDSEKENLLRTYFMGKKEEELTPEEKKEFDAFKDNFKKKVIVGGAENAIAIGKYAKASKNDTIALGKDSNAVEEKAIAIGKEARAKGAQSVVIGTPNSSNSKADEDTDSNIGEISAGQSSVSVGNGVKSGDYSVGIGGNVVAGKTAVAIGDRSRAIGDTSVAIGEKALAKGPRSIAIGNETKANAEDSYVFGGKSEISSTAGQSSAIGINISVKSAQAIAMGNDVVIEENSRGAVAIGSDDSSYNEGNNKIGGNNYTKTMAKGNATTAIGAHAQATNVAATALGARAFATEKETVAVGANSKASVEGAVAIGSYSLADRVKNTTYYNPKTGNTDGNVADKLATKAALSIGDANHKVTRQLIGLAAGTNDTDAVNVWQLKELKGYFDENKNFKLEGDNNREQTFELPNKLEIKGNTEKKNDTQTPQNWDNRAYTVRNIQTFISKKGNDAKVLIGMKSNPEFEGITLKTITEDKNYKETESNVINLTPTADGLLLNSKKISGLSNGTNDTDAVAYGQVKNPFIVKADSSTPKASTEKSIGLGTKIEFTGRKFDGTKNYDEWPVDASVTGKGGKYTSENVETFVTQDNSTGRTGVLIGLRKDPRFDKVTLGELDNDRTEITKDGISITKKATPDKVAKFGIDNNGNATLTDAQNTTASPIVTEKSLGDQKISYAANNGTKQETTLTTGFDFTSTDLKITTENDGKVTFNLTDTLKNSLNGKGNDGKDGKDGTKGNDGAGSKGLTGKDGLNGKDLTTKVNALRNGEAGTVVYTDKDGNRLVKANNGDYYKADDVDDKGNAKQDKQKVTEIKATLVNPDGTTDKPTTVLRVADGSIAKDSKDAINGGQLHTELGKKLDVTTYNKDKETFVTKTELKDSKVEVEGTKDEIVVTSGTKADGKGTKYTVKLDDTLKSTINGALQTSTAESTYAKKDGSNVTGLDDTKKKTWATGIGTSSIGATTKDQLVTDSAVKTYVDGKGLKFTADNAADKLVKLGETLSIVGRIGADHLGVKTWKHGPNDQQDKQEDYTTENVTTHYENGKLFVGIKENPTFKKITLKDGETKQVDLTPTTDGLSLNNKKLTGLADATSNTDAINKKQFDDALKGKVDSTDLSGYAKVDASNLDKTNETTNRDKWINKLGATSINKNTTDNSNNGKLTTEKAVVDYVKQEIDTVNKSIGNNTIAYKANSGASKTTSLTTGFDFTSTDLKITTENDGKVTFNLTDTLKNSLNGKGNDGKDGKDGTKGNDGAGSKGLTGKDGLNGKDLTTKVNALRNGEAGTVVYTDKDGNRLVKANNGDYYKADDVDDKGNAKQDKQKVTEIKATLVNPDGTTDKPTTVLRVADGSIAKDSKDAINGGQLNNLGYMLGLEVNGKNTGFKAPKIADLKGTNTTPANILDGLNQTREQINKGLTFEANYNADGYGTSSVNKIFGETLSITASGAENGKYAGTNNSNYTGTNLATYVKTDNGKKKIFIGMKETPTFNSINIGSTGFGDHQTDKGKGDITADNEGLKLSYDNASVTIAKDGDKAKISGLKDANINENTYGTAGVAATQKEVKAVLNKINANGTEQAKLKNGTLGTLVYTDKDGNKLMKDTDGKFYKAKADGTKEENAQEVVSEDIILSTVKPDGKTTEPITLGNVASALGLSKDKKDKNNEILNKLVNKKSEEVYKDAELNKVVTLRDLQFLASKGIIFAGSTGTATKFLGDTITINGTTSNYNGLDNNNFATKYETKNIAVKVDNKTGNIEVGLAKELKAIESIENKETKVTLTENGTEFKTGADGVTTKIGKDGIEITKQGEQKPSVSIKAGDTTNGPSIDFATTSADNKTVGTGSITGLEYRKASDKTNDYGTGKNIGRAATEGAVKEVYDKLSTVEGNIKTLNDKGLKFAGNSGTTKENKLGDTVNIKGEGTETNNFESAKGNINVVANDSGVELKLSANLKNMKSFETEKDKDGNSTKLDQKGLTITDKDDKNSGTKDNPRHTIEITKDKIAFKKEYKDGTENKSDNGIVIDNSKGTISGVKDGNTPDSVVTKGYIDNKLKSLDGNNPFEYYEKNKEAVLGKDGKAYKAGTIVTEDGKVYAEGTQEVEGKYFKESDKVTKQADGKFYKEADIKDKKYDEKGKEWVGNDGKALKTQPTEATPEQPLTGDALTNQEDKPTKLIRGKDDKFYPEDATYDETTKKYKDKIGKELIGKEANNVVIKAQPNSKPMTLTNIGDGRMTANSTDAVNGGQVYEALKGKLNVDADNLTDKGKTNLIEKLSTGADISNPSNVLVTDKQVNEHLKNNYYNKTQVNNMISTIDNKSTVALEKSELALGGVANAVAMANLVQVNSYSRHRHNLSAAYGYYGGSHALAVGFSGTNEERNFVYKLSGSVNNKGNLAFGVGAGVMLGEEHDTFPSIDNKKIKEVTKKLEEANKKISEYEDDKKQTAKKFKELEDKYENDKKESNKKLQEMERKLEMLMKKFK